MRLLRWSSLWIAGLVLVALGTLVLLRAGAFASYLRRAVSQSLESALNQPVVVTSVTWDLRRGLILLTDVRVGNAVGASPEEAKGRSPLLSARRLLVRFDPKEAALGLLRGGGFLAAIREIGAEGPLLRVTRDPQGKWNLAGLFARRPGEAPAPKLRARIVIHVGTLVFADARVSSLPFRTDLEQIEGEVDLRSNPLVLLRLVGRSRQDGAAVSAEGKYILGEGTLDLEVRARGADLARWGEYLFRTPELSWAGGEVDARLNLLISRGGAPLDYRGTLTFRDGEALLATGQRVSSLTGPVEVDRISLNTSGLHLRIGSSPLLLRGEIRRIPEVYVDLVASSPFLDLTTLKTLFFPGARLSLSGRAQGVAWIVGPGRAPRIEGIVATAGGAVYGQPVDRLRTRFSYDGRSLALSGLTAKIRGGVISGDLYWDLGGDRFAVKAEASNLPLTLLERYVPGKFCRDAAAPCPYLGRISGEIIALGRGEKWNALLGARLGRINLGGMDVVATEGVLWFDRGTVTLDQVNLRLGSGQAFLAGRVNPGEALSLRLSASDLDVERIARAFPPSALRASAGRLGGQLTGLVDAGGMIQGTVANPRFAGRVTVRGGHAGPLSFDRAQADLQLSREKLSASDLQITSGSATIRGAGSLSFDDRGRLRSVEAFAEVKEFPVSRLAQAARFPLRVEGEVEGTLRLQGPPAGLKGWGEFRLEDAQVEGQRVDSAEAKGSWADGVLTLDRLEARINDSKVSGRGTVAASGDLNLEVSAQALHLEDFSLLQQGPLESKGEVTFQGEVQGNLRRPAFRGQITSNSLTLNDQAFDAVRGQVEWSSGRLSLLPLELRQGPGVFRLSGSVDLNGFALKGSSPKGSRSVNLTAQFEDGRLKTLMGLARLSLPIPMDGRAFGAALLRGPLHDPSVQLDLRVEDGVLGGERLREASGSISWQRGLIRVKRLEVLPEKGRLVAQGTVNPSGESLLEVSGEDLSLSLFNPLFVSGPLRGTMDFIAQLSGPISNPLVGLSMEIQDGGIGEVFFNRFTAQSVYQGRTLFIDQALLSRDGHKAKVQGEIPFDLLALRFPQDRPINLRATLVDADLSLLSLLTPSVTQAKGTVEGEVSVSGTVASPRMIGRLGVGEGTVRLAGVEPVLEGVAGELSFTEGRVDIRRFEGKLGGGKVEFAGSLTVRNFRPDTVDLQLTAHSAAVKLTPYYTGTVGGQLHLSGPVQAPLLDGQFELSQGELTLRARARQGEALIQGTRRTTRLPSVGLNLLARAGRDLWIQAGGVRAKVAGEVRLLGTLSHPALTGTISATEGQFGYLGTTFDLVEGKASFSEFRELVPYLTARATTTVGSTHIYADVEGTPSELKLHLSSEPPLPREEIVALLSRQAGLEALMHGDLEGALRLELSRLLFGWFERSVEEAFDLSEFRLEYDFRNPLRLRIGKLLFRDLYFTITHTFDSVRQSIVALEYRLTPTTALSLNYDPNRQFSILLQTRRRF